MEELIAILNEVNDDVDYKSCESLVDDNYLDSFNIVFLVSQIRESWGIAIPANEIVPENFNSAKRIYELIERLEED